MNIKIADTAMRSLATNNCGRFWPDSLDITLPGQGHSWTSSSWPCETALTQAFIQQASVAHLNTSCVAAIPAPTFPPSLQALAVSG